MPKRQQDWHAQGYPAARFWTEPVGERFSKVGTYELYRVACNLATASRRNTAKTLYPGCHPSVDKTTGFARFTPANCS